VLSAPEDRFEVLLSASLRPVDAAELRSRPLEQLEEAEGSEKMGPARTIITSSLPRLLEEDRGQFRPAFSHVVLSISLGALTHPGNSTSQANRCLKMAPAALAETAQFDGVVDPAKMIHPYMANAKAAKSESLISKLGRSRR